VISLGWAAVHPAGPPLLPTTNRSCTALSGAAVQLIGGDLAAAALALMLEQADRSAAMQSVGPSWETRSRPMSRIYLANAGTIRHHDRHVTTFTANRGTPGLTRMRYPAVSVGADRPATYQIRVGQTPSPPHSARIPACTREQTVPRLGCYGRHQAVPNIGAAGQRTPR